MVDADPNVHQALEVLKDLQREGGLTRRLDRPRTRRLGEHLLKCIFRMRGRVAAVSTRRDERFCAVRFTIKILSVKGAQAVC